MQKKILFMVINMNVGGTEKALLNLIETMPKEKYNIKILMLEFSGGFLKSLPEWVKVEEIKGYEKMKEILHTPPKRIILNFIKNKKFMKAVYYLLIFLIVAIKNERSLLFAHLLRHQPIENNEYDVAVAYAGPMDFISYYITKKVRAKKKYQWIHFDVSEIGFNVQFATKLYKNFDKIFAVSRDGVNQLIRLVPSIKNKTEVFTNITIPENIVKLAKIGGGFQDNFNGIRVLTVGRLSKEKGQDLIIPVLAHLKYEGFNIRWYCIGDGNARNEYESMIKEYGIEDEFILMGAKHNPYPFMQQCDIYVQPSRHEGYCLTLAEAKCFNLPIISTKFAGVSEHITHLKTGLITETNSTSLHQAVREVIKNSKLKNELISNLKTENLNEATIIRKKKFSNL
ncbi:glycosyltransferase [Bacillus sp. ISL-35]|uniref:glycosyltransferase n=1 Tax=Bacillus sp. ISL-35 TaxID=2819122 RepID=UPI001BE92838|nr:glycosyltransferase [Bacillus sp. ISL-35]MBT2679819.1 glycosyltransferase [Bacillus sp. ISL-35]MBT2704854.1 glycosyltransferase [Chryseobacterium sp. ISL-80]